MMGRREEEKKRGRIHIPLYPVIGIEVQCPDHPITLSRVLPWGIALVGGDA
jgi:hypothetical protein